MAKEWVWNACNEVRVEAHSRLEVEKALGALKEEHIKLANKLTIVERERQSTLMGLKNAEAQAEDQRQGLHPTEINLATKRQMVSDLKAEL